ncbi:MAG: hypothetical protein IKN95_05340, partial [Lachnospiraceae bacterium]|nr:hypothetical protein [Lachnospiraceae bacterium]
TMTFEEAEVTLVCKKLFMQRLDPSNIIDKDVCKFYENDAPHDMYIGEIVDIIKKSVNKANFDDPHNELFVEEP